MNPNGPFRHKVSNEIITHFLMKELFPTIKKLRRLTVATLSMKRSFWSSIFRRDINRQLDQYRKCAKQFIKVQNKWNEQDILFKGVPAEVSKDTPQMAIILQDQQNMNPAVQTYLGEGLNLLTQSDKILTSENTASYTRITIVVSAFAVFLAAIATLVTVF